MSFGILGFGLYCWGFWDFGVVCGFWVLLGFRLRCWVLGLDVDGFSVLDLRFEIDLLVVWHR